MRCYCNSTLLFGAFIPSRHYNKHCKHSCSECMWIISFLSLVILISYFGVREFVECWNDEVWCAHTHTYMYRHRIQSGTWISYNFMETDVDSLAIDQEQLNSCDPNQVSAIYPSNHILRTTTPTQHRDIDTECFCTSKFKVFSYNTNVCMTQFIITLLVLQFILVPGHLLPTLINCLT